MTDIMRALLCTSTALSQSSCGAYWHRRPAQETGLALTLTLTLTQPSQEIGLGQSTTFTADSASVQQAKQWLSAELGRVY